MILMWVIAFLVWLAFTGVSQWTVIVTGLVVTFLITRLFCFNISRKKGLTFFRMLGIAIVTAYKEAFDLILSRSYRKGYDLQKIEDPSPWGMFQKVFLVTLTPKTVSVKLDGLNEMLLHRFEEEKE